MRCPRCKSKQRTPKRSTFRCGTCNLLIHKGMPQNTVDALVELEAEGGAVAHLVSRAVTFRHYDPRMSLWWRYGIEDPRIFTADDLHKIMEAQGLTQAQYYISCIHPVFQIPYYVGPYESRQAAEAAVETVGAPSECTVVNESGIVQVAFKLQVSRIKHHMEGEEQLQLDAIRSRQLLDWIDQA